MLGKTAAGLFWMFRYLERSENSARLVDAGFRIALTRPGESSDDWSSFLASMGVLDLYLEGNAEVEAAAVINFMLRDRRNPSSVLSSIEAARENARVVRTALTREVWEAINNCRITLSARMARPVADRDLPELLDLIRKQSAQVRGALHGTMLRNDIFNFCETWNLSGKGR